MTLKFYWHIHHLVLVELATEPITNRRRFIKLIKSESEVPTRLRLLKRVKGKLPDAVVKAGRKYVDTQSHSLFSYQRALRKPANKKAIEKLHRKECKKCPWDGETIFPRNSK